MTEVEEELARTKALLRQLQSRQGVVREGDSDLQDTRPPDGDMHKQDPGTSFSPADVPSRRASAADDGDDAVDENDRPSLERNPAQNYETPLQSNARTSSSGPTDSSPNRPIYSSSSRRTLYRRAQGRQCESETHSVSTTGLSLEAPPSSGSFEWDERTGKASGDRFVDGMASLTSRSNEGGYLGIAFPGAWYVPAC